MSAPERALVIESPVKKSANGIAPPMTPIKPSCVHSLRVSVAASFHLRSIMSALMRRTTVTIFFNVVKNTGSETTVTPILVIKLFVPEISAAPSARSVAYPIVCLFIFKNYIGGAPHCEACQGRKKPPNSGLLNGCTLEVSGKFLDAILGDDEDLKIAVEDRSTFACPLR